MFCYHKQHKKTFTVCDNRKLKDMRILEDDDGFPENDSLFIIGFLHDNLLDAFAELVDIRLMEVEDCLVRLK